MKVKLAGMDPSLRNLGIAKMTLDTDTMQLTVDDLILVTTKPADKAKKKAMRQNCIDLDAAKDLFEGMQEHLTDMTFAVAEVPVGSQSARAMASYGICVGVLSGCPIPLIAVSPTEVKKAGYGEPNATKEEQIEWAVAKYPHAPWLRYQQNGKGFKKGEISNANEHLADAVAAVHAGLKTPELMTAIKMLASIK